MKLIFLCNISLEPDATSDRTEAAWLLWSLGTFKLCYDSDSGVLSEELVPDFVMCHFKLYLSKLRDWQ